MIRSLFTFSFIVVFLVKSYSQIDTTHAFTASATPPATDHQIYHLKPGVDIPITAIGAGWSLYAFTKIYSKDPSTAQQIQNLRISDINGFDRWGADVYSKSAADISDGPFYISMPLPVLLLLDKHIRKDAGKIGFLYLEAMSVTGLLYTSATYFTNRYRPYAYNTSVPLSDRMSGGAKNSFFAGHVALVGTSTFFIAKVFSDYHPHSKLNWILYTVAIGATGTTGYLRHKAGKHFPSDILLGAAVGTLSGILVPNVHKNKWMEENNISLVPFSTGSSHGLTLVYTIGNK